MRRGYHKHKHAGTRGGNNRDTRGQVGNRGLWVGWGEIKIKIKMPLRNNLSRLSVEEKNVYV